VTAISGNHHRRDFMIGPAKALDSDQIFHHLHQMRSQRLLDLAEQFQIAARACIPKFAIRDMVNRNIAC